MCRSEFQSVHRVIAVTFHGNRTGCGTKIRQNTSSRAGVSSAKTSFYPVFKVVCGKGGGDFFSCGGGFQFECSHVSGEVKVIFEGVLCGFCLCWFEWST